MPRVAAEKNKLFSSKVALITIDSGCLGINLYDNYTHCLTAELNIKPTSRVLAEYMKYRESNTKKCQSTVSSKQMIARNPFVVVQSKKQSCPR